MSENADPIKILWTGGWDSTFRLLQAVLMEHKCIQPYYLREHERRSSDIEISTMDLIKEELFSRYPNTNGCILPTIIFNVEDIKPCEEISESYRAIASRIHLGSQFDWLARFCRHHNIEHMELCIESGGTNRINRELMARFKTDAPELDEKYSDSDIYTTFQYYRFPLIETTKLEMADIARKNGFSDLMNMTWFCHAPINDLPCGKCNPCVAVMRDGLVWRIPTAGKIRYYRRIASDSIKDRLRRFPAIHQFFKNLKESIRS